jgi:hypothetical protein
MKIFTVVIILTVLVTPLEAQWLQRRTPGIPRSADGKPNLTAPAPRTADGKPDLAGLWEMIGAVRRPGDLQPADVQPWAQALVQQRAENFGIENPRYKCLPGGPSYSTGQGFKRILQTPAMVVILQEDLTYRQIHMDGRALETDPNPTWMGYSVGRWEGDTLVVESNGYNDRLSARLAADTEMMESVCNERPDNGQEHWVGRVSDAQKSAVKVAPEVLAKYVGVYKGIYLRNSRTVEVTFSEGRLSVSVNGGPKQPIVPQSETKFSGTGLSYQFIRDDHGIATAVLEGHISGDWKYERQN